MSYYLSLTPMTYHSQLLCYVLRAPRRFRPERFRRGRTACSTSGIIRQWPGVASQGGPFRFRRARRGDQPSHVLVGALPRWRDRSLRALVIQAHEAGIEQGSVPFDAGSQLGLRLQRRAEALAGDWRDAIAPHHLDDGCALVRQAVRSAHGVRHRPQRDRAVEQVRQLRVEQQGESSTADRVHHFARERKTPKIIVFATQKVIDRGLHWPVRQPGRPPATGRATLPRCTPR